MGDKNARHVDLDNLICMRWHYINKNGLSLLLCATPGHPGHPQLHHQPDDRFYPYYGYKL